MSKIEITLVKFESLIQKIVQSTYRRTWRADPKLRASEPKKRLWALWRPRKVRKTLEKFSFFWQNCKITEVLSTFVKKTKYINLNFWIKHFLLPDWFYCHFEFFQDHVCHGWTTKSRPDIFMVFMEVFHFFIVIHFRYVFGIL